MPFHISQLDDMESDLREETRRPEPDDLGMPAAKESMLVMDAFPAEGRTIRGGVEGVPLVYVTPSSEAYTGTAGSQTITFNINSTTEECIIPSQCFIETQVAVRVGLNGGGVGLITSEDRICLKNHAAALMWRSVDAQLNGVSISDDCHLNQQGASPGYAAFLNAQQTKDAPYGASGWSRAWVPAAPTTSAAARDITTIGSVIIGGTVANISATSSLVGAMGGDTAILEGVCYAQPPVLGSSIAATPANQVAAALNCHSAGENSSHPTAGGSWTRHYPLIGSAAAEPTTLLYQPAMTIFTQKTPLLPGSRLQVTLTKNPASMWLQAQLFGANADGAITSVEVNFIRCRFWVKKVLYSQSLLALQKEFALSKPYTYDFVVRRIASYTIPATTQSFSQGNILAGPQLSRGYVMLTRGAAINTDATNFRSSPFAMSPDSLLEANDATGTDSAGIPLVVTAWVRSGSKQYPLIQPYQAANSATTSPQVDLWRAYMSFIGSCRRSMFGGATPLLSFAQFVQDYLVFTFDMLNDPNDDIASTVGDATSAAASSIGLELFLQFQAAVADPTVAGGAPALRVVIVGETSGAVRLSASGGVEKIGF